MTDKPCCTYDFTIFNPEAYERSGLIDFLKEIAKKWCFQKELGEESGKEHFQGRLSLKVKERLFGLKKRFVEAECPEVHLSVTSTVNRDNNFYVLKDLTRIEGPWMDTDITIPASVANLTLREWQKTIEETTGDGRTVNVLYDEEGGVGKSTLVKYLCVRKLAQKIPTTIEKADDLMQWVMSFPEHKIYFFDMPRATGGKDIKAMYTAIEEIVGGYAYDKRYHGREMWFSNNPSVWVFCNSLPDQKLLTKSRWKIWVVAQNKLVKYEPKSEEKVDG